MMLVLSKVIPQLISHWWREGSVDHGVHHLDEDPQHYPLDFNWMGYILRIIDSC